MVFEEIRVKRKHGVKHERRQPSRSLVFGLAHLSLFIAVVETPWAAHSERECYDSVAYTRWKVFGSHWLMMLMTEPSALHVLGKCSITEVHLQAILYSSQSANS